MKKYLFSAVCLLLAITVLFSACTGSSTQGEKSTESPHDSDSSFRVAIVQFDNDSFTNELRQMFIKRMRLLGYDEAKMKFDIKNAQETAKSFRRPLPRFRAAIMILSWLSATNALVLWQMQAVPYRLFSWR